MVAVLYKAFKAWLWRAEAYAIRRPGHCGRGICVLNAEKKEWQMLLGFDAYWNANIHQLQLNANPCDLSYPCTENTALQVFALTLSMSYVFHDVRCVEQTFELASLSFSGIRLLSYTISPRGVENILLLLSSSTESHSRIDLENLSLLSPPVIATFLSSHRTR